MKICRYYDEDDSLEEEDEEEDEKIEFDIVEVDVDDENEIYSMSNDDNSVSDKDWIPDELVEDVMMTDTLK